MAKIIPALGSNVRIVKEWHKPGATRWDGTIGVLHAFSETPGDLYPYWVQVRDDAVQGGYRDLLVHDVSAVVGSTASGAVA